MDAGEKIKRDFRESVERTARIHGHTVHTSRGQRYVFLWRAGALHVRVSSAVYRARPLVEWLASELGAHRPVLDDPSLRRCRHCRASFAKQGKRRYCSARCASRARKARYTERKEYEAQQAEYRSQREARFALLAHNDKVQAEGERKRRNEARRQQRRGRKIRQESERLLDEREKAFRAAGGKDR